MTTNKKTAERFDQANMPPLNEEWIQIAKEAMASGISTKQFQDFLLAYSKKDHQ